MIPWTPETFFTNAADRFLRTNTAIWASENFNDFTNTFGVTEPFTLTNIPVLVSTRYTSNGVPVTNNIFGYTPSVHRALQVVANIYDSTTNRAALGYPYFPTVFRPIFRRMRDEQHEQRHYRGLSGSRDREYSSFYGSCFSDRSAGSK